MGHVSIFWTILIACSGFAIVSGGSPERIVAVIFLVGAVATSIALPAISIRYGRIEIGILLTDTVMLVGLLYIAIRSTRYWPSWIAALQILQVCSHFTEVMPQTIRLAYGVIISFWCYPMLLVLAVGTVRHRVRVSRFGQDADWLP